jgi:hypothetical protein
MTALIQFRLAFFPQWNFSLCGVSACIEDFNPHTRHQTMDVSSSSAKNQTMD